jgi:hypothetical protein
LAPEAGRSELAGTGVTTRADRARDRAEERDSPLQVRLCPDSPHFGAEGPGDGHGGVLFGRRSDLEELDESGQGARAELGLDAVAPCLDVAGVDRRRARSQEVSDVLDTVLWPRASCTALTESPLWISSEAK